MALLCFFRVQVMVILSICQASVLLVTTGPRTCLRRLVGIGLISVRMASYLIAISLGTVACLFALYSADGVGENHGQDDGLNGTIILSFLLFLVHRPWALICHRC